MVEAFKDFFNKYAVFTGRTSRRDYWLTVLALFIISCIISVISSILGGTGSQTLITIFTVIYFIWCLAIIVPGIAICVRRLHDINKSGWWILIDLVPLVGPIILIVFMCLPAVNEGNNY